MTTLLDISRSKLRRELLQLYFSASEKEYYVRELERLLRFSAGNIRRELLSLTRQGLFVARRQANLVYYRLNTEHPLHQELRSIVCKTLGIEAVGAVPVKGAETPTTPPSAGIRQGGLEDTPYTGHATNDASVAAETVAEYEAVAGYIAPVTGAAMLQKIEILKPLIAHFCRDNHIKKLAVFGSVLRDDFGPSSDVDVLVEFESGKTPGFAFVRMQDELSALLGRNVDLGTFRALSPYIRDEVLESAQVIYEKR